MAQIKVAISDNRGSVESVQTNETDVAATLEQKEAKKSSKSLAVASMVGSQALNYTTSNIGKWTGSQRTQTAINNVMQLGTLGMMAYINPVLAITTAVSNIAITALNTSYEQRWDARQKEYNRIKVGELKGMGH